MALSTHDDIESFGILFVVAATDSTHKSFLRQKSETSFNCYLVRKVWHPHPLKVPFASAGVKGKVFPEQSSSPAVPGPGCPPLAAELEVVEHRPQVLAHVVLVPLADGDRRVCEFRGRE